MQKRIKKHKIIGDNRFYFLPVFCVMATLPAMANGVPEKVEKDTTGATTLKELIVDGSGAVRNRMAAETGHTTLSQEQILDMPVMFAEPDIVKTLQTLPGVSMGSEGFTSLLVRGGENDQNLFLYHGIPLYHVSHLGGVFSSFNVATVGKVDFYKGSFPAMYGGRTSSVVDITMQEPDFEKFHGQGSVGLLSVNAYVTGPLIKGKTAFSAGVRRTWLDLISIPALAIINHTAKNYDHIKHIAGYGFTDINLRFDHKFNHSLTASAIGYFGHDNLKLGQRDYDYVNEETDYTPIEYPDYDYPQTLSFMPATRSGNKEASFDENTNRLGWGNIGVTAGITWRPAKGVFSASFYYSSYSSTYRQEREYQQDTSKPETFGFNRSKTHNSVSDVGLRAGYIASFGGWYTLQTGAGYCHHRFLPEDVENRFSLDGIENTICSNSPVINASEEWIYVDNEFRVGQILALSAGLRGSLFQIYHKNVGSLEPRATIRFSPGNILSFKASYGRMRQYVQQVSNNYINLPTDLWQPVPEGCKPLTSDQYSFGVYATLPYDMYVSAEGWYKDMKGLLEYRPGISMLEPQLTWEEKVTSGNGWSYGADFSLTKEAGSITGTISYGLMWAWRKFEEINGRKKFPGKYDNRHKININVSYRLNKKIEFNAGWTYMTGNRMTLSLYNYDYPSAFPGTPWSNGVDNEEYYGVGGINYIPATNNIRIPDYHRLDLGMQLNHFYRNGNKGVWNFSLYNAYCRMNPITVQKDSYIHTEYYPQFKKYWIRRYRALSFIPIIPSFSYTYIF